jgi:hypothetical protein
MITILHTKSSKPSIIRKKYPGGHEQNCAASREAPGATIGMREGSREGAGEMGAGAKILGARLKIIRKALEIGESAHTVG